MYARGNRQYNFQDDKHTVCLFPIFEVGSVPFRAGILCTIPGMYWYILQHPKTSLDAVAP